MKPTVATLEFHFGADIWAGDASSLGGKLWVDIECWGITLLHVKMANVNMYIRIPVLFQRLRI